MALAGKLEADLEINAPAVAFYDVWKSQCHHLPNATPSNMQAVEVHEGDWETAGSIKLWNYTVVIPKESGSLLKLTLEYEKRSEDVPVPNEYLDFMVSVMTDLAAHLTKA
ncbi:hypothetical protein Pint_22315 [Pistacia integerrima]|uniref:Uncharacterized protein n=1 Tax=Pistacia integerrima TaxID=434235 RepID=A0ACC0YHZ7_9ROSI|nr:hypothetical protein Pint_22315 [Pistacia integerrima]